MTAAEADHPTAVTRTTNTITAADQLHLSLFPLTQSGVVGER